MIGMLAAIAAVLFQPVTWGGAAEPSDEVTLQQALEHFYQHNYDILINKYQIDKAAADVMGAKLLPNPNLSISYTGLEAKRSLTTGEFTEQAYRIDQLIELSGKRALRTSAAQENLEATRLFHQDLIRGILVGFYSLYFAIHQDMLALALNEYELQSFDRILSVAEKRYSAGFLSLVDYSKLKVTRTELENNVLNAQNQLKLDTEQFRLLLGIDGPIRLAAAQLQKTLPDYPEAELIERAYQNRKDLLALQRQLKSSEFNVSLAKAYRIPDITVGAEFERWGSEREPGYGFGISVPIPLFNRNQAEIARRSYEYKQNELQIEKAKKQIVGDVRQALQNYLTARKVYEVYQKRKNDIEDLRERSEKSFALGGITVLDLLDTQKMHREFINKYNQAGVQGSLNHELLRVYTGER